MRECRADYEILYRKAAEEGEMEREASPLL